MHGDALQSQRAISDSFSFFYAPCICKKKQSLRIVKYDVKPNCVWLTSIFFAPENYGEQRTDGMLDMT